MRLNPREHRPPPADFRAAEQGHPARFDALSAAGGDVAAYHQAVRGLHVRRRGGCYRLQTRGPRPITLYAAPDGDAEARAEVDWLDFTIEMIAGLVALMTGIRIGREGYKALKPLIDRLWEDPLVRERVQAIGAETQRGNPLAVGKKVAELWRYLWAAHRGTMFRAILKAVGRAIGPRALLEALIRWLARLISGGAALFVELGLLVIPLGRKVRGRV
jgi:hypothetical protein